mmetsp:Transcript_28330/g.34416  ORF Transcript_28330/g.34416 Transcript_28330/m.34416 type:complete len:109 (-) Transcript_28330:687-1013(-)
MSLHTCKCLCGWCTLASQSIMSVWAPHLTSPHRSPINISTSVPKSPGLYPSVLEFIPNGIALHYRFTSLSSRSPANEKPLFSTTNPTQVKALTGQCSAHLQGFVTSDM